MVEKENKSFFDREKLLKNFSGDEDILLDIMEAFVEQIPKDLETLKESIALQDFQTLELKAHSLKGLCANFCAENASRMAFSIESLSKEKEIDELEKIYASFDKELNLLKDMLLELIAESKVA